MEVLLLLTMGAVNLLCFVIGARVGQKVSNGEEIKLPSVNPVEAVKAYKEEREKRHIQSKMDAILENMENYSGSSVGQREIPR